VIGGQVEARQVIDAILVMYLMENFAPRRCASDAAFGYQLVQRVGALASTMMGVYYDSEVSVMRSM